MRALKIKYDEVPWKQFRKNPGLKHKPVKLGHLGFTKNLWTKGASEALHSHKDEPQIVMCLRGKIEFDIIDDQSARKEILTGGDVLVIDPGVQHGARALEETEMLVMWSPMNRFDDDAIIVE
jgi:mannose-6-phosphate isomerase-like protein (cupin superfamily)